MIDNESPLWFPQLSWTTPVKFSKLQPQHIPILPGCYLFTPDDRPILMSVPLYIGRAINLRSRLKHYSANEKTLATKIGNSRHAGCTSLLKHTLKGGCNALFVRWCLYGDPRHIEDGLIDFLDPLYNHKREPSFISDDELLDPFFQF